MEINIKITRFEAEVKPIIRNDNIKAFVTWIFYFGSEQIKIYGGTIRLKPFGENDKQLLSYDPPAIGARYIKVIYFSDKALYLKLCLKTVQVYCEMTGELPNNILYENVDEDSLTI